MDRYLLDTHTAMWYFNADRALSKTAQKVIRDDYSLIHICIASVWEIAIKINIGKLNFPGNAAGFKRFAKASNFVITPIKTRHLTIYENLPLIHRDPFDRLLVATAIAEEMTLITADNDIAQYDVPHVW